MRTFIAIDFDKAVKKKLAELQARLRPTCGKVKWVNTDQVHLTVKFLGETTEAQVPGIREALDQVASRCGAFDIGIEQLGVFGRSGPVRVLWVDVRDPTGRLAACHALCEQLLEPVGFDREARPFSPHLTLARNKSPQNSRRIREAVESEPSVSLGSQAVAGLTLYESTLTQEGPVYRRISKHAFRA